MDQDPEQSQQPADASQLAQFDAIAVGNAIQSVAADVGPQLPMLSADGKMAILSAMDFAARREGFAGTALDAMNAEMRGILGA